MRRQRKGGDDPHLAAPRESVLAQRAAAEGFPIHSSPMRGTWDLRSILFLAGLHRALRPDVVHWHAARAHALGALASLLAPGPARILSRRVDFLVRRSPGSRFLYSLPVERIIAISDGVRDALIHSGVARELICVVSSGVDLAPFDAPFDRREARQRLGLAEGDLLVLQVAALAPHKSQTDFLNAAALLNDGHPHVRFWIAGEGPLRAKLETEHRALGLGERLRFLGFREDVTDLLRAADIFCISSYLEGLGTSILDAMAAGLPVVATRVGGIPEIVEDGKTGLLVPARDPRALGEAIAALAGDPAGRAAMGARARERVQAYSADRTSEGTRRVYLEVLGRSG